MLKHKLSSQAFGEDISFGLQQTLACWATDFIDPYIGKWFQDKFKDDHHQGTLAHTWGGEIIGDSAAFFTFLAARRYFSGSMENAANAIENSGVYDQLGKRSLKSWACEHHASEDAEEYQRTLAKWKHFQAENFVKSSVISVSSIAFNVGTQKALGNTHKLSVITASKVVGAAITTSAMLGLRLAIPKSTEALDRELAERYFAPVIRRTQRLMGAGADEKPADSHLERLKAKREREASQERA